MAVDSRDKRFSLIGFGYGAFKQVLPNPDGSDWATSAERAHGGLWLYAGISIQAGQPIALRHGNVPFGAAHWMNSGANSRIGRTW